MIESRPQVDRCPGVRRPFRASDGAIVRIRKPGGRLPVAVLRHLLNIAQRWGDGMVYVTSRGNIQLRALPLDDRGAVPGPIADAISATGLVPPTHELVRNMICSPLAGAGRPDLLPLVDELDTELLDVPLLAELPGRFMWAFDNGSGDVAGEPWDLCYQSLDAEHGLVATAAGQAWDVPAVEAPSVLLALAQDFQLYRTQADHPVWHVDELATPIGEGFATQADRGIVVRRPPQVGRHGADLVAGAPLGRLTADMIGALSTLHEVQVTPWRSVLVPDAADHADDLAAAGWTVDPADPWASVSACTGLPGCRKSSIGTEALARNLVAAAATDLTLVTPPIHISGCARRCGEPHGDHIDLLAPRDLAQARSIIAAHQGAPDPTSAARR